MGKVRRTPQGGMRVDGAVGRSGVLRYTNPDGSERVEYRPPEEAFAAVTLETLQGAPVTLGHPGMVRADNFASVSVGHASDSAPKREGDLLVTTLVIQDARAIAAVEKGDARELSLGYLMDFDPTPGTTPDGTRYDGVQRNVRINHVALVAKARAGERASLRLDSEGNALPQTDNQSMKIEVINGIEYEVGSPAHREASQRRDAADKACRDEVTKLTGERDAAIARASAAEQRFDAEVKGFGARVAARVRLEKQASEHGVKCDGMSDDAIKRAVISKLLPDMRLDGKDESYVAAAYDVTLATPRTTHLDLVAPPAPEREDADDLPPDEKARLKYMGGRIPAWAREEQGDSK